MSSDALETRNLLDKSVQIKKENSANYLRYVIAFALVILCGILASIVNVPNRISISTSSQLSSNDKVYYATLSSDEKLAVFEDFKIKFGKDFLDLVDERNSAEESAGGTGVHGITMFSDLTTEEFRSNYLGYKDTNAESESRARNLQDEIQDIEDDDDEVTGGIVNWAGVLSTPIKNQGYCGSCWAFSATSQIESDSIRAGYLNTTEKLSPQQIVSCDHTSFGCDGGLPSLAYQYVQNTGGLERERKYPYTSMDGNSGSCEVGSEKRRNYAVTVESFHYIDNERDMKRYVRTTGPLSVCVSAETWSSYSHGTMSYCGNHLPVDHCVQLVGVNSQEKYWVIRNSWSTQWGVDGYMYLDIGHDTCRISSIVTYTNVSLVE